MSAYKHCGGKDAPSILPQIMSAERAPRFIAACLAVVFLCSLLGFAWLKPLLNIVMHSGLIYGSQVPAAYARLLRGFVVSGLVMSGGALLLWRVIPFPKGARGLPSRVGLVAVATAFLVSVAVRWPSLGRALSDGHEYETAFSLVAVENQRAYPLTQTGLAIPFTYPGEANQVVSDQLLLLNDASGVGYYVNVPPFSTIVANGVMRLPGLPIVPETLRGLNLVFHFVASLLLFLVLLRLLRGSPWRTFSAFVGIMFFMFNPAGLWFFSNIYGWAFFWQYLWVISLFILVQFMDAAAAGRVPPALWIGLSIGIFCLAYTEVLGVLCVAMYVLCLLARSRENRNYLVAALVGAASAALALGLTIFQYSRIAGFDALMEHYSHAFARRCLLAPADHLRILMHYIIAHLFLLVPLGCMWLLLLASGNRSSAAQSDRSLWRWVLLLTAAPVVFHHLLFLQWTSVHSFSVLKAIVPLTILVSVVIDRVMNSTALHRAAKSLVLGLLLASVAASLVEYRSVFSYSHDPDRFRRVGDEVRRLAAPEEVVFLASDAFELFQVTYYSKRNTRKVASAEDAYQWMKETGRPRGILFSIDQDCNIVGVKRLAIDHPTSAPRPVPELRKTVSYVEDSTAWTSSTDDTK